MKKLFAIAILFLSSCGMLDRMVTPDPVSGTSEAEQYIEAAQGAVATLLPPPFGTIAALLVGAGGAAGVAAYRKKRKIATPPSS